MTRINLSIIQTTQDCNLLLLLSGRFSTLMSSYLIFSTSFLSVKVTKIQIQWTTCLRSARILVLVGGSSSLITPKQCLRFLRNLPLVWSKATELSGHCLPSIMISQSRQRISLSGTCPTQGNFSQPIGYRQKVLLCCRLWNCTFRCGHTNCHFR